MNAATLASPDQAIKFRTTHEASYRLMLSDLAAAQKHALSIHQPMAFGVEFISASPPFHAPERYVVITEADYHAVRQQRDACQELAGQLGALLSPEQFAEITGTEITEYDQEG